MDNLPPVACGEVTWNSDFIDCLKSLYTAPNDIADWLPTLKISGFPTVTEQDVDDALQNNTDLTDMQVKSLEDWRKAPGVNQDRYFAALSTRDDESLSAFSEAMWQKDKVRVHHKVLRRHMDFWYMAEASPGGLQDTEQDAMEEDSEEYEYRDDIDMEDDAEEPGDTVQDAMEADIREPDDIVQDAMEEDTEALESEIAQMNRLTTWLKKERMHRDRYTRAKKRGDTAGLSDYLWKNGKIDVNSSAISKHMDTPKKPAKRVRKAPPKRVEALSKEDAEALRKIHNSVCADQPSGTLTGLSHALKSHGRFEQIDQEMSWPDGTATIITRWDTALIPGCIAEGSKLDRGIKRRLHEHLLLELAVRKGISVEEMADRIPCPANKDADAHRTATTKALAASLGNLFPPLLYEHRKDLYPGDKGSWISRETKNSSVRTKVEAKFEKDGGYGVFQQDTKKPLTDTSRDSLSKEQVLALLSAHHGPGPAAGAESSMANAEVQ
ncbi:uncharacterized protein MKK02DRAFT_39422 [Dioszegia hungarica]|uniref:Uncharacterized protein n=1 Tax=Dioszegia hungarica TaxID=4972 RepID=A0AA38HGI9_9TREE|nr:uncharacterized protein MKK02DRAFT_39422 [Dioszegia hungarica]KAI9639139.1 hypothetical protein MKK02DRAFT_39422 [Dioszegia hungarica]